MRFSFIVPKDMILLVMMLISLVLFVTACGDDDDDDDDNGPSAEETIAAIVAEMTEGYAARTPSALEAKVFMHISEEFSYAGFDKQASMNDALNELEEDPWLHVDDYDLTVVVTLGEGGKTAVADTSNEYQATIEKNGDSDFDVSLVATLQGRSHFALEEDGEWRVITGEAMYNQWLLAGGDETLAMDVTGIGIDVQEIGAGGSAHISGAVDLPEIEGEQQIWLVAVMSWEDERANAEQFFEDSEVYYSLDLTTYAGQTFNINMTLPDDGQPANIAVPTSLPLGVDAVTVQYWFVIIDDNEDDTSLRADGQSFSLPFMPLANEDPCPADLGADADGLWKITMADEGLGINQFELFDLRLVGDDVYGSAAYVSEDAGQYAPIILELTGTVDGDQITLTFDDPSLTVTYAATLFGAQMNDGTVTFDDGDNQFVLDFTGEKIDNRCEGLSANETNGAQIVATIGGLSYLMDMTVDYYEIGLSLDSLDLAGYLIRNVAIAVDPNMNGQWYALGFFSPDEGYIALVDNAAVMVTEGSFTTILAD